MTGPNRISRPQIRVTDHAILRFAERALKVDLETLRRKLAEQQDTEVSARPQRVD